MKQRDRLACFGVGQVAAALAVRGRRVVVAGPGETIVDLVRDLTWVPAGVGARLFWRGWVRSRALCVLGVTENTGSGLAA